MKLLEGCEIETGSMNRVVVRPTREEAIKLLAELEVDTDEYEHPEHGRRLGSIPRRTLAELGRRNGLSDTENAMLIAALIDAANQPDLK